jgi:hypothetical protein
MKQPSVSRFFIQVLVFLCAVVGIVFLVFKPALFMINPWFNGAIVFIWVLGIVMALRSLLGLWREEAIFSKKALRVLNILRPVVHLYEGTPHASRAMIDQVLDRCYQSVQQDLLRYMAGSLIFLGLLGTLWGLSETIVAIADVIGHLPGQDAAEGFLDTLKNQLQQPLTGMGVAFSSSLLGVAGTLTMGFVIVQLDRATETFFQKAALWSETLFKDAHWMDRSGAVAQPDVSLARWADGIERLGRIYINAEKRQKDLLDAVVHFGEKGQTIVELIKAQQFAMGQWAEAQNHNRQVLEKLVQKIQEITFSSEETKACLGKTSVLCGDILREMTDPSWIEVLRQELSLQRRVDQQRQEEAKDAPSTNRVSGPKKPGLS